MCAAGTTQWPRRRAASETIRGTVLAQLAVACRLASASDAHFRIASMRELRGTSAPPVPPRSRHAPAPREFRWNTTLTPDEPMGYLR
ncbi:hypothetical protein DIE21_30165 [Burkholderia sp. Bp9140]|nr:hypothetical protein DIE21_30165 [Burkholderia sp. Bp9140]